MCLSYQSGKTSINLPEYDGKTTHGVLVLDDGIGSYYDKMLPTLLEEGSTLTVVPPANASAPKPSWVDTMKTYIGNDKIPKKPK